MDTPIDELRGHVAARGVEPQPSWGAGKLLLELYEKTAEPTLWGPVLVTDFPAEVSPLSRRRPPPVPSTAWCHAANGRACRCACFWTKLAVPAAHNGSSRREATP